jgi:PAS domain S-box-containing protein
VADRGLRLPLGEGMSGRVAQQGEPLLVTDYPAWPGQSALFKDGSYRSVMGAPIMRQGQVIGVLSASDSRPNRFGPPDMEALRLLATQAGVAIQTAQLFEQSQRRAEEMYLLYTMGAALSSGQDLYHALRALVKELRRLMVADVFYVVIYDEPTDQIAYPLYLNLEDDLRLPSRSLSANPGLTGEVIAARRTLYLPDISQPEVQQAHQIVVIVDMGVRSYLGIPLFIGDRIVGVLSVQARRPGAYSPEQIRLLETLATQVAATVEKSRLMEQLQQELAERKRAEAEAQQSEERYRAAITAAGMVPYVIDYRTGRFTFIGEGILTLTGYPAEALTPAMMKASIQEEYIWGAGAHLTPEGPRRRFLAGEIREWRSDMRIRTPAGASRWISDASIALLDEAGQARGAIGLLQDITERKQAEAEIRQLNAALEGRVQERTAQLEAANKELEAFSYSVSHDLRAPLRAIDGFSRVLLEEHTNRLDAEGQRYLQRVRVNTQRMGQLIDDLLKFSRLSRLPIQKRPVDPAELARQALGELRPDKGQTQADIEIADLPACQADPALLRLVFVNLLDNALKYSSRRTPARIAVGWQPPGPQGEGAYFVRDNGVGFDMQYADKLFGVFQRLHGAEEFEGTGVGLATVARILRRHGGRIWAEAEVNKGATFFFTLGQEAP